MTIDTLYSPGDVVYFMKNNQIITGVIFSLIIQANSNLSEITYRLEQNEDTCNESSLFASPNDVISNLTVNFPDIQNAVMAISKSTLKVT